MCVRPPGATQRLYPDVAIVCGEPAFENGFRTLTNPTAIVEVLSEESEAYDRGEKFHLYRTIGSLFEYVLVAQNQCSVERFLRQDDGAWWHTVEAGSGGVLAMPSCRCVIALKEIYDKVPLS
jgi:Uma2 family endonuclease